ncbi:MAG: glycosyltransferase [Negativicutes bacterium]|nr:glycosyltransferase [Negativicutes bacterium]
MNNQVPLVSVIIPSYNHAKYIAEAIQSVLDQDFQDFEIIVVDDGSQDNSVAVIQAFTDPRVKLTTFAVNQGGSVAANHAIRKAAGRYLAVLSSDDVFLPQKLSRQVCFLADNPNVGAVFSYAQLINETGDDFVDETHFYHGVFDQGNRGRHQWLNHFFFQGNCLCHPSMMIRRGCFDRVGFYDERLAQLTDLDYWIRLCMTTDIHILPEKLVKFRIRDGEQNASGYRPDTRIRCSLEIIQVLNNYLKLAKVEDIKKIFGDYPLIASAKSDDPRAISYILARIAYDVGSPSYKYFALHTLYHLMKDNDSAALIKELYGFSCSDLVLKAAAHDVFGILHPERISELETGTKRQAIALTELGEEIAKQKTTIALLCDEINKQKQIITDLGAAIEEKNDIITEMRTFFAIRGGVGIDFF